MCKKLDDFVTAIKNGVVSYFTKDFLVHSSDDNLVLACKKFLKYKGYRIIDPITNVSGILNNQDLVDLFYNLKKYNHPEEPPSYRNRKLDSRNIKFFVEARMEAGNIVKEQALKECALIIRTLFTHEKEFKFKYPITIFSLGQKKSGWITEKALAIMNKVSYNKKEKEAEDLRQSVLDNQNLDEIGFNDFNDILKEMEKENA
jgi:hypothetical protein